MKNWFFLMLLAILSPGLATVAGCSGQPGEAKPAVVTEEEIQENEEMADISKTSVD